MPLSFIDCFARVILRVTVCSEPSRARAISAALSPPTARNVRATCDAVDSEGWQHMNSKMSVSSASPGGRSSA